MTESEIINMLREDAEGLFPRVCPSCGRQFATLREYVIATQPLWPTLDYDLELGNYSPSNPIGRISMANCSCGTTMALSSKNMPLSHSHQILEWVRTESQQRGLRPSELTDYLREEARKDVLSKSIRETETGVKEGCGRKHG